MACHRDPSSPMTSRGARLAPRLVLALTLISTFAAPTANAPAAQGLPDSVPPALLQERIRSGAAPVILDVRSVSEYRAGHIPGAINVPVGELPGRLEELIVYKNQALVIHCEAGPRADRAVGVLQAAGFTDLHELDGHMRGWRAGGFPVE